MEMVGLLDRWFGRAANAATFWTLLPAGVIGVIAGLLSRGVSAIDAYGGFGWLMAGLFAFVTSAAGLWLLAVARDRFALASAKRAWSRKADQVNPLDAEFTRQRIRLTDLGNPLSGRAGAKRFIDCQLLGPATVFFAHAHLRHVTFDQCDVVVLRDDREMPIHNATYFDEFVMDGGMITKATILVTKAVYDASFRQMGATAITFEGVD